MKIAVFPGSFDPITIGHVDIVKRSIPLFDKIIIAIGVNTQKKYFNGRLIGANSESGFKIPNLLKIIKAYEFKFNCIYSNNELNDKINENLNYKKSFVSIVHCDTNVRLIPSVGTKLLKNGDMISESLDKQKD
jgi:cytidyltransferase-like protein